MDNKLSTLGLCKKAGKLVGGFDPVAEEIKKPKSTAAGILLANNVSEKTKKEVVFITEKFDKKLYILPFSMEEIGDVIGKKTGVLAVLDEGFYKILTT